MNCADTLLNTTTLDAGNARGVREHYKTTSSLMTAPSVTSDQREMSAVATKADQPPPSTFGPTHSISPLPSHPHTHTIIFLHGRGSTGEDFAEELFDSFPVDSVSHFQQRLPTWRWVFPSSCSTYDATFQEYMPSWFYAPSVNGPFAAAEEQIRGLRESVKHVKGIVTEEIEMLDGKRGRVFLGGISQGGAVAMWTMLSMGLKAYPKGQSLGGLVLASTWLPFARDVERVISRSRGSPLGLLLSIEPDERDQQQRQKIEAFIDEMLAPSLRNRSAELLHGDRALSKVAGMPVFIGHGTDDAYVDFALGRQARDIFKMLMSEDGRAAVDTIQWKEYTGADQEGHWLKVPEEVNHIIDFLGQHSDGEMIESTF